MDVSRVAKRRRQLNLLLAKVLQTLNVVCAAAATTSNHYISQEKVPSITWQRRRRGARNIRRGSSTWITDYLGSNPVFSRKQFRKRFRIPKGIFLHILKDLTDTFPDIWKTRQNAAKQSGVPSEIRVLACLRRLGTARSFDDLDDGARMSAEILRQYFEHFCRHIVELYGSSFLNRRPSRAELDAIQDRYTAFGFARCIGAVNCSKLEWKNCPYSLKGQYHNSKESKLTTLEIEAWCDRDLYIWHWFAGRCGTNNDQTMLPVSPLFNDTLNDTHKFRLSTDYRIPASTAMRELPYYLADGIYPDCPLVAKPLHHPSNDGQTWYTKRQEGLRKGKERAFRVIQARFFVMIRENYQWYKEDIVLVSQTCLILHNMIVRMNQNGKFRDDEAEEGAVLDIVGEMYEMEQEYANTGRAENEQHNLEREEETQSTSMDWEAFGIKERYMTTTTAFRELQADLIESVKATKNTTYSRTYK